MHRVNKNKPLLLFSLGLYAYRQINALQWRAISLVILRNLLLNMYLLKPVALDC